MKNNKKLLLGVLLLAGTMFGQHAQAAEVNWNYVDISHIKNKAGGSGYRAEGSFGATPNIHLWAAYQTINSNPSHWVGVGYNTTRGTGTEFFSDLIYSTSASETSVSGGARALLMGDKLDLTGIGLLRASDSRFTLEMKGAYFLTQSMGIQARLAGNPANSTYTYALGARFSF